MKLFILCVVSFGVLISCKGKVSKEANKSNATTLKTDSYDLLKSTANLKRDILKEAIELKKQAEELSFQADISSIKLDIYRFKYDDAERKINELLKEFGQHPDIYLVRGILYLEKEEYEKAKLDFDKAFEMGKRDSEYYQYMSEYYKKIGEIDSALENINKAINMNPESDSLIFERASIYELKGDYKKALADYEFLYKNEQNSGSKKFFESKIESLRSKQ